MLRPWLSSLLALALLLAVPAQAQEFTFNSGGLPGGRPGPSIPTLFRATACSTDISNTNIYNHTLSFTGVDETWPVFVVAVLTAEDALATFSISQLNIAATFLLSEDNDQGGTGIVNAGALHTAMKVQAGATIPFVATHSEAVTSSVLCGWVLAGMNSITVDSNVADEDTASGALVLTTGTTNTTGFVMGACTEDATAQTTTWAVLTEREDTCNAEACYSSADAVGSGASMANTCDWTGTADAAGAAIAVH